MTLRATLLAVLLCSTVLPAQNAGPAKPALGPEGENRSAEPPASLPQAGLLYSEDFEGLEVGARVQGHGENGFQWTSGFRTIVVSDDYGFNGENSLRFDYPGESDLCEDATREQRFRFGPEGRTDIDEVWIEYMVRVPDNFHHRSGCGPINNKLMVLWAEDYGISPSTVDASVALEYNPALGGTAGVCMIGEVAGDDHREGTRQIATEQGILFSPELAGEWVRVRVHFKVAVDGGVEVWRDDTKVGELLHYNTRIEGGRNYLRFGYIFGWSNSGFEADTNFYVDDFRVWTADPEWTFGP